jgi:ribosomal protein L37AE/L43A
MKAKLNKYKCHLCKKTIKRRSEKKWIYSICSSNENKRSRLMLIKKRINEKSH